MEEIWRKLNGLSNYEFSNLGNARSLDRRDTIGRRIKGKPLEPKLNQDNLFVIRFTFDDGSKNSLYLHRIIAELFVSSDIVGKTVIRIDGDVYNLRADNLKVDDPSNNILHNIEIGFRKSNKGSKFNKMSYAKYFFIKKAIDNNESAKEISKKYGISTDRVYRIKQSMNDEKDKRKKKYAIESIELYKEHIEKGISIYELTKKYNKRHDWVKSRIAHGEKIVNDLEVIG